MVEKLRELWGRLSEKGQHHLVVLGVFVLPAALLVGLTINWIAAAFVFIFGSAWGSGYYGGRERIFEKAGGDHSSGGRWVDFTWPSILALAAIAVSVALVVAFG